MKIRLSGTLANRPAAGSAQGAYYLATDAGKVYESAGAAWVVRSGQLDEEAIVGRRGGTLASRPSPSSMVGWLFYASDEGKSYEAFPTGWVEYNRNGNPVTVSRQFLTKYIHRQGSWPPVMGTPPTVTVGTSLGADAITSAVSVPLLNGTTPNTDRYSIACNFPVVAGTGFPNSSGITPSFRAYPLTAPLYRLRVVHEGLQIAFRIGGSFAFRVFVDGELAYSSAALGSGNIWPITLTFGARASRLIEIDTQDILFFSLNHAPGDSILAAPPMRPRFIAEGDSFSESAGCWAQQFAELMGWQDYWTVGVGSTGFHTAGIANVGTFRDRLQTSIVANAPDVVMIAGGINDPITVTDAQWQAEQLLYYTQLRAALPNTLILSLSPFWKDETAPAHLLSRDAITKGIVESPDIGGIHTSVLNPLIWTASNKGTIVGDGTHPNAAGCRLIARVVRERLLSRFTI